jgi:hypothetical protein
METVLNVTNVNPLLRLIAFFALLILLAASPVARQR